MSKGFLFLGTFLFAFPLLAQQLGVHGHLFDIEEIDLLEVMTKRLKDFEQTGELKKLQTHMQREAQKKVLRPKAISNITKASQERRWTYDPSISLKQDLKDHQGRVFYQAGSRLNPLNMRSMTQSLLFLDGDDEAQVAWAREKSQSQRALWILVKGAPLLLQESEKRPIYFDQEGSLTRKLEIRHVPCWVRQEGKHLLLEEYPLKTLQPNLLTNLQQEKKS